MNKGEDRERGRRRRKEESPQEGRTLVSAHMPAYTV
jgi:hypothetical protein